MQGNAKSMVLSMIACLAGCLVLLALVPRQAPTQRPTVEDTAIAREVAANQKWDVAVAKGLAKPWRPVNVHLIPADGKEKARWMAGYQGKGSDFVSIQQTKNGGSTWTDEVAKGSDAGTVDIGGTSWRKVNLSVGDQKALVRTSPLAGLDTIVTGKGDWSDLQAVATSATPYSKAS